MAEFQQSVWAPWRMDYIDHLPEQRADGCFLCHYRDTPSADLQNLVLWRTPHTMVLLNRFPYTSGHVLVAPLLHVGEPEEVPPEVHTELMLKIRDAVRVLRGALHAQGFNVGMNLGHCAGAGLPDHLHWHVVPRWSGDVNFMPVVASVKVIPQSLEAVRGLFLAEASRLGL